MRNIFERKVEFGTVAIEDIFIDLQSRDEIPSILRSLQYIYCNTEIRDRVFSLLRQHITLSTKGRKGMCLWNIFVLGVLRVNANIDYDKLLELANNHITIRQMLGHSDFVTYKRYGLQTIKDNASLLTEELLMAINYVIVSEAHKIVNPQNIVLKTRCDSAVTPTNVHFPTDASLLWDAMRKSIILTGRLFEDLDLTAWRQYNHNLNVIHRKYYSCAQHKQKKDEDGIFTTKTLDIYDQYLSQTEKIITKINISLNTLDLSNISVCQSVTIGIIKGYINDAEYQKGLIVRRIFGGETIQNKDKIHSIFERHTEWICKGKAGISQELGIRIAILEDQFGFILSHRVMQEETDDKVPVEIIKNALNHYPNISSCSFDKGFWSPENRIKLEDLLDVVAMKKKGYSSKANYEYEHSEEFLEAKKGHSAVESAFNGLQNSGLDKCPDRGIKNYKKYIALAIVAKNIQKLGKVLINQENEVINRSIKIKEGLAKKNAA
ncbi:ISNCY family transposase [bacterium]|jgi:transposase, IS5 family|nr:ISNCY family transposase [bacterium]